MYKLNGKEVTQEEFCKNAVGIVAGTTFNISSMQPFQSPIDGKMIGSSADLAAHNKEHDVYQIGNEQKRERDATAKLKREETLDTQGS